jgi:hypothetical protein
VRQERFDRVATGHILSSVARKAGLLVKGVLREVVEVFPVPHTEFLIMREIADPVVDFVLGALKTRPDSFLFSSSRTAFSYEQTPPFFFLHSV